MGVQGLGGTEPMVASKDASEQMLELGNKIIVAIRDSGAQPSAVLSATANAYAICACAAGISQEQALKAMRYALDHHKVGEGVACGNAPD